MKVMIVGDSSFLRESVGRTLRVILEAKDVEVINADHENALVEFLEKEPDKVIICDYDEHGSGTQDWNKGKNTYRDIKGSADEKTVVIRMGFSSYDYEDYLKAPFHLLKLFEKLQLQ